VPFRQPSSTDEAGIWTRVASGALNVAHLAVSLSGQLPALALEAAETSDSYLLQPRCSENRPALYTVIFILSMYSGVEMGGYALPY
jgi:hypothetical protein